MVLLWSDLKRDVETMLGWKVKGLHPARFFGLRQHPIHEICLSCGKQVDFPVSRKCPLCRTYQDRKNPMQQRHNGLDLAKARGTMMALPWDGKVEKSYFDKKTRDGGKGGGWSLIVSHTNSIVAFTGYCHMDEKALLKVGESYPAGEILGAVGSSGDSTGPHLHWTCRKDANTFIDPLEVLMLELVIAEIPWHSVG
jgi:murein DD-endopeptidase MepM/ murein hydrolase activator NlpD